MKLNERITLLKAGYTKDDINKMIEEDNITEDANTETDNTDNDYMKVLSVLANEVKDLKNAVYSSNISNTNVTDKTVINAEDILSSLINPKTQED